MKTTSFALAKENPGKSLICTQKTRIVKLEFWFLLEKGQPYKLQIY